MVTEARLQQIIQEEVETYFLEEGKIKDFLSKINIKQMVIKKAGELRKAVGRAKKENIIAAKIILTALRDQNISSEEATYLKQKSIDFAKVINLLGFQFIPGGNMILQIANALLKKKGVYIFPQGREIPDAYKTPEQKEQDQQKELEAQEEVV